MFTSVKLQPHCIRMVISGLFWGNFHLPSCQRGCWKPTAWPAGGGRFRTGGREAGRFGREDGHREGLRKLTLHTFLDVCYTMYIQGEILEIPEKWKALGNMWTCAFFIAFLSPRGLGSRGWKPYKLEVSGHNLCPCNWLIADL